MDNAANDGAPSASWREIIPDDEIAQIRDFAEQINRYQKGFAQNGDGQAHRGFHVKSHAALGAEFHVMQGVPDFARHGVFREPHVYPAWVRLTNGFSGTRADWSPDLVGCSVKLLGVTGTKLLPDEEHAGTQDFLALNQRYLPAANPAQLMIISTSAANVLTAPFKLVQGLGLSHALRVMLWSLCWSLRRLPLRSVSTEDFFSAVPITIGPHAVKFTWKSRQTKAPRPPDATWRNYLRDDLRRRLANGELRWDFVAQFFVDDAKTPLDGAYAWDTRNAPPVKLAELVIPPCDIETEAAKRAERMVNGLSFNPWHAIAEHRPVGNIQRARGMIYQASARYWGRDDEPAA
jgi:hypothetical protein